MWDLERGIWLVCEELLGHFCLPRRSGIGDRVGWLVSSSFSKDSGSQKVGKSKSRKVVSTVRSQSGQSGQDEHLEEGAKGERERGGSAVSPTGLGAAGLGRSGRGCAWEPGREGLGKFTAQVGSRRP